MIRPIWTEVCLVTAVLAMTAAHGGSVVAQDPKPRTDGTGDSLPEGALARLGTLRWSHPQPVIFVAFLPDGKAVLTGCEDRIFRLWDRDTGKEIRRFVVPPTPATKKDWRIPMLSVVGALSVDGKTLATAADEQICFWDVATGKKTWQRAAPKVDIAIANATVKELVFAPDGKSLAVRTIDETVHVIAADTGKPVGQFRDQQEKRAGLLLSTIKPTMAFSPDGKCIATADREGEQLKTKMFLRVREIESGKELWRVEMVLSGGLFPVAYAPNGKLIAAGTRGNDTKLFDADSGKLVHTIENARGWDNMLFSPDGKYLLGTFIDYEYATWHAVWSIHSGEEVHRFGTPRERVKSERATAGENRGLAVSADGKTLAAGTDNTVRMWDLGTRKEIALAGGSHGTVLALAVGRDGKRAISRGTDGMIRVWDLADNRQLRHFAEPNGTYGIAFAPDGQSLACGGDMREGINDKVRADITIVDTNSGQPHKPFKTEMTRTAPLAYSPDSKMVASLGVQAARPFDIRATKILLHDVATGAERIAIALPVPPGKGPAMRMEITPAGLGTGGLSLAFSPDRRTLIGHFPGNEGLGNRGGKLNKDPGTPTTLRFWDVATGRELRKVELPARLGRGSMALGPDGRVLACENSDGTISAWELASGKERVRLRKEEIITSEPVKRPSFAAMEFGVGIGPRISAPTVAFSPDGRLVAFKGPANAVRIWDVDTATELGTFSHDGDVTTLAFTPDSRRLIIGSTDTTLLVWDVTRLRRPASLPKLDLSVAEQKDLWNDLVGDDAGRAFTAIRRLAASPEQAVPLLREKIKPAVPPDPKLVERLIGKLDSDDFDERDGATNELVRLGDLAVPALQKVTTGQPTLEMRRRVETLLLRLTRGQAHVVRAVEVLERAATPEARQAIEALAKGAPAALVTREAQAALDRLR
jgi:WD40 repeat protein